MKTIFNFSLIIHSSGVLAQHSVVNIVVIRNLKWCMWRVQFYIFISLESKFNSFIQTTLSLTKKIPFVYQEKRRSLRQVGQHITRNFIWLESKFKLFIKKTSPLTEKILFQYQEKTEVLPTSTTTSEEDHFGEGWGLTSSFGVEEDDSGEISQGPKSSSPILTRPTDAPRSGGKQGAHTYSALNDTDHQQEKKGRKRTRRRCSPGHFGCRRPTKAPPKRVRHWFCLKFHRHLHDI